MKIKLIPVLEIFHPCDRIGMPKSFPYWLHQDEWEEYKRRCLLANGFSDMKPYLKGSSFYQLSEINDHNLLLHQIQNRRMEIRRNLSFRGWLYIEWRGFTFPTML